MIYKTIFLGRQIEICEMFGKGIYFTNREHAEQHTNFPQYIDIVYRNKSMNLNFFPNKWGCL
jgi:hypothetical protein